MKGGPGVDKDGGEAAPQNRPGPTAVGLRYPAVNQCLVSSVDIRNAREIYNERSEGKHSVKRMVAFYPRSTDKGLAENSQSQANPEALSG